MSNLEKYKEAFMTALELTEDQLSGLEYKNVASWDYVGHIALISAIEEAFDIMMDTEDIIAFSSFEKGKEILSSKYDVEF